MFLYFLIIQNQQLKNRIFSFFPSKKLRAFTCYLFMQLILNSKNKIKQHYIFLNI
jgi:hypothetical protein